MNLRFGEGYDDPTRKLMDRALQHSGMNYGAAASALWNQRERRRKSINDAGGQSLLQVENETRGLGGPLAAGDQRMMAAATMLNNLAASGGKTAGKFGTEPDPVDPRLTTQGRNAFQRAISALKG